MNYKCLGCGVDLQSSNKNLPGYTRDINGKYCERCFRIKHYNEYQIIEPDSENFYKIIESINKTNSLVLFVVDIMGIGSEFNNLASKLKNKPLIVMSKRDIFSYKIKDQKLLNLIDIPCLDKLAVSANKNYNIDLLIEKINKYKKGKDVFVVGLTNSGKSTLINKIIYDYTDLELSITTSMLPSTTLNTIEIIINDNLRLIDTPGIVDSRNITNYLDNIMLKKLLIKKEIRPLIYQVKCKQYILIENILKIECLEPCNLIMYFSNKLKVTRVFKDVTCNLIKQEINTTDNCDVVIVGLGFISINKTVKLNIYTYQNVEIYIRSK